MKKQNFIDIHNVAQRMYGQYKAEHVLKAKEVAHGEFEQPLPDMIGLKQHGGECASDCIQELILFADEIREYTQPIFYGLTEEQIELRTKISLDYESWFNLKDYLYYVQKRFKAHYDVIKYLKTHKIKAQKYYDEKDDLCELNPLFRKKERTSIEAGILAVKRYKKEEKYSGSGLTVNNINDILTSIFKCTSIPFYKENNVNIESIGVLTIANLVTIMDDGFPKKRSLGHAVSFFKTLGKWVFYDDNLGFIPVDEEVLIALKQGRLRIVNYKKVYFVKTNQNNDFESVWSNGIWDKDLIKKLYVSENKLHIGLAFYTPYNNISINKKEMDIFNESHKKCNITKEELTPKTTEELVTTMSKFNSCIYSNMHSNSMIFENMYSYISRSIELVKKDPDILEFIQKTVSTVVLRPACSPMTHYWCYKIQMGLKGAPENSMNWFEIPKIKSIYLPIHQQNTPKKVLEKLEADKKKNENNKSPHYTPCLPGQVRNAKTRKCRDRIKKVVNVNAKNKRSTNKISTNKISKNKINKNKSEKTRRSPCPKGMVRNSTQTCVEKKEPCPPGQIRDKKTRLCKDRFTKEPCPPGQIRDSKTKECRDVKAFKF